MRTIRLNFDADAVERLANVKSAIARLALWAFNTYPVVEIHRDGGTDLIAVYSDPSNLDRRYVIGAVWSDSTKSYSFHS